MFKVAEGTPRFEGFNTGLTPLGLNEFNNEPEDPKKKICLFPLQDAKEAFGTSFV